MKLEGITGLDFSYAGIVSRIYSTPLRKNMSFKNTINETGLGPYLSVTFKPIEMFSVNAGARFDTVFVSNKNATKNNDKNWRAFVYDTGVTVNPLSWLKVYAKYSTNFRYPFTDELSSFYGTSSDYFNDKLKPEKGYNAEGGLGVYFDQWKVLQAQIQANVYYMRMSDEIAYGEDSDAPETYPGSGEHMANINMDKTQRIGSNISLTMHILEHFELNAAYTFVKATFAAGANKNKYVPLVPQHTIDAALIVKLPYGFAFGPDVSYRSNSYAGQDFANKQDKLKAFSLWGLSLRYALDTTKGQLSVMLRANNLADKKSATYAYYSSYSNAITY
jgi:iron complex outermembrane receptor protein